MGRGVRDMMRKILSREAYFVVRLDVELDFFARKGADSLNGAREFISLIFAERW